MGYGYIITDRFGKEIVFCDGTMEDAKELRDAVFGFDVVPLEDYEDPEESED